MWTLEREKHGPKPTGKAALDERPESWRLALHKWNYSPPQPALELEWDATPVGEGLRWMVKGLWDEPASAPAFSTNGHAHSNSNSNSNSNGHGKNAAVRQLTHEGNMTVYQWPDAGADASGPPDIAQVWAAMWENMGGLPEEEPDRSTVADWFASGECPPERLADANGQLGTLLALPTWKTKSYVIRPGVSREAGRRGRSSIRHSRHNPGDYC